MTITSDSPVYPVHFFVAGHIFKWFVMSRYPDGRNRTELGPYRRRLTALRIEQALTKHFRNGFDMGDGFVEGMRHGLHW